MMFKQCSIVLFVCTLVISSVTAQPLVLPYDSSSSIQPGDGFDMLKLIGKGSCFASNEANTTFGGQEVEMKARYVESSEEFHSAFSFGFSAGYSGFGIALSGGMSYFNESSYNRNNVTIIGKVTVRNSSNRLSDEHLSDSAIEILGMDNGLQEFHRIYGHKYVKSVKSGGTLYISIIFKCHSRSQKNQVMQELSVGASTTVGDFNFDQDMSSAIERASSHAEMTIEWKSTGGSGLDPSVQTWDDVMDRISKFPQAVADDPVGIQIELGDYNDVPDYVMHKTDSFNVDPEAVQALSDYYDNLFKFQFILHDLNHILNNRQEYFFHPISYTYDEIKGMRDNLQNDYNQMETNISNYTGDENTLTLPTLSGTAMTAKEYSDHLIDNEVSDKILPLRWLTQIPENGMVTLQPNYDNGYPRVVTSEYENKWGKNVGQHDIWQTVVDRIAGVVTWLSYDNNSNLIQARITYSIKETGSMQIFLHGTRSFSMYKYPHLKISQDDFDAFSKTIHPFGELLGIHGALRYYDTDRNLQPSPKTANQGIDANIGTGVLESATVLTGYNGPELSNTYAEDIMFKPITIKMSHVEEDWPVEKIAFRVKESFSGPNVMEPPQLEDEPLTAEEIDYIEESVLKYEGTSVSDWSLYNE